MQTNFTADMYFVHKKMQFQPPKPAQIGKKSIYYSTAILRVTPVDEVAGLIVIDFAFHDLLGILDSRTIRYWLTIKAFTFHDFLFALDNTPIAAIIHSVKLLKTPWFGSFGRQFWGIV